MNAADAAAAAAAAAANAAAANAANAAAIAAVPAALPGPAYEVDYDTAITIIGVLPSLEPRPTHANIRALERTLFERLEQIQSAQSEEWGFRGLAEQPAEYALKSATPWVDSPNPGPHRPVGLNAQATRDAEATYEAEKTAYLAQVTVTRAVIAALNLAVPRQFKRGTNAAGNTLLGSTSYRSNHDPRAILQSLRDTYGTPSPTECQANDAAFAAPWDPQDPIEAYFDRLEDCYVNAVIAKPPYTIEQLITRAIMGIQLTGLYTQALIEWQALPPPQHTWDHLKTHFTAAYVARIQSGAGTAAMHGYHTAANITTQDDAIANIESTLTNELSALQLAHNTTHASTLTTIAQLTQQQQDLRAALDAAERRIAALTTAGPPGPPTIPPAAPPAPQSNPYPRQRNNRYNSSRGGRRYHNNTYNTANSTPPPSQSTPPVPPPTPDSIPPAPSSTSRLRSTPNPNKFFNNWNYCFSCGYDIPYWHTSATCNNKKRNHQPGCTRQNVAQYEAMGHQCSKVGIHKTILPVNPRPDQA